MQKIFVLIFYCTFHEILLLLIVKGGAINFDALHQLLYLLPSDACNSVNHLILKITKDCILLMSYNLSFKW